MSGADITQHDVLGAIIAVKDDLIARIREREVRETGKDTSQPRRSYSLAELLDEMERYIEERAQAGEDRNAIASELIAYGRERAAE